LPGSHVADAEGSQQRTRSYSLAPMRTRTLGPLEISLVGLGCNNFGRRVDEPTTRAVVDAALDAGVIFFDTADRYGDGLSETFLGSALRGRRQRVVLATKFGGGGQIGRGKGSPEQIRRALEASLRRLQTDYLDLYQHHQEDPETPLAETIGALDELVREGKIYAYGTSNYSPARIEQGASLAQAAYVSEQSEYSWLARDAERELLPTCARLGLGLIPYFPLAHGLLTGKYRRGQAAP
jgi:aryl-alcohol dehydrogenase-like predicted oxidoreductase